MTETTDLKELYRRTVLEHSRNPRHFGQLKDANHSATGHNPLCGDKCTVYLQVSGQEVAHASFEGAGCAICMASASIMSDSIQGRPLADAQAAAAGILKAFSDRSPAGNGLALDGEMAALGGVRDFPSRIRCATLPWKTLQAALEQTHETVTTETKD